MGRRKARAYGGSVAVNLIGVYRKQVRARKPNARYPQAVSSVPFLTNLSGFAGLPAYRYSGANAQTAKREELLRTIQAQIATRRSQRRQRVGR